MSLPPNTFFLLFSSFPLGFQPGLCISPLVCSLNPSFFMHFTHLNLGFGFSWNFLGFLKIDEYFVKFLGLVLCFWCYRIMHCIPFAFSQCFMHLDVCLYVENCVLIGLDWVEPMIEFFFAYHMFMHFFLCIRTLSFLYKLFWVVMVFFCFSPSLSLSLSLSFG